MGKSYNVNGHRQKLFERIPVPGSLTGEKFTEDYSFCRRWTGTGGKIWVVPDIDFVHTGINRWSGNYHEHLLSCPEMNAERGKAKRSKSKAPTSAELFTDIIVPTYNNEELTAQCFRSIKKNTAPGTYRIIWVDNGSNSTAKAEAELVGVDHIVVHLQENKGFVGAINEGLRLSNAPTVCLLNNDTVVTGKWLEKLTKTLYSDPKIGIIGPLTGYGAGPAYKEVDSHHSLSLHDTLLGAEGPRLSFDEINSRLEQGYSGRTVQPPFVAFLCAVIKREAIDAVTKSDPCYAHGLDSNFAMGMYDDNDYNEAVRALGYKTLLALDTCIYHRGRSTFTVVEKTEGLNVGRLLVRNKRYMDSKKKRKKGDDAKAVMVALYPYQSQGLDAWLDHGAGMTYTSAKAAGRQIDFIDMKALANDIDLFKAIRGYGIVAFGLKSSYYALGMKIIEMAKSQGARVLVGGYHATAAPRELLENPDIDWVLHGESEITFPEFLQDPSAFPREIFGEKPPVLDDLPFMDRSMYRDPLEPCGGWWHGGRSRMVSVMAARGCAWNCAFCQPLERNHFGTKIRRRSVDNMIAELLILKRKYNPDCVMIHDDTFLYQPKWIEEFIEKYPQVGLPFWAAGRADGICKHPDLVKKLIGVGWELVSVGFESGSQKILDLMKKGTTVEQNFEAAWLIKSFGAKIYANYMIGLPWETQEDMKATAAMAKQINAEMPSWAFFTPYPGCELGERCIEDGLSLLDRNSYDRCPSGRKVKNVDYGFINQLIGMGA